VKHFLAKPYTAGALLNTIRRSWMKSERRRPRLPSPEV
jgi:hypothetical protein